MFSASVYGLAFQEHAWTFDLRSVLPHGFFYWIFIGLIAGWLAGKIARGRGFGCIADIILGIVGSFIGGWVFVKLGIFGGRSFWYSLAAATLGAIILVSIAHLFTGSGHDR